MFAWNLQHTLYLLHLLVLTKKLADGVVDVTLVVPTPIVAYEGEVFLKCVANDSFFKAAHFPFGVDVDVGTGTSMTHDRRYGRISPEPWPGRQVHLIEKSGPHKFGVFSCLVNDTNRGITAKATSVVMSLNALLFPTTLTKRASWNEAVRLKAVQLKAKSIDDVFWFRLNENKRPEKVAEKQLQINIAHVRPSHAGTYIVFHRVRQNTARIAQQGIMRLVVRSCPAGRYGGYCNFRCPPCKNGGVCDDVAGSCICPPGFMGEICEIGCGSNRFGAKCQHKCVEDEQPDGCKAKMFCLPDPYGCTCATGYEGLICTLKCPKGKYGEGCKIDCHCLQNQCNPFTGHCATRCMPGWLGAKCQQPCGDGSHGLDCKETCGWCENDAICNHVTGVCPPQPISTSGNNTNADDAGVVVCKIGFMPPLCKERCIGGRWGRDCSKECHCYHNTTCDLIEGTCPTVSGAVVCEPGWRGVACNETCLPGTFGEHCSRTCGRCYNQTACHPITGNCTSNDGACEAGFRPKKCTEICLTGTFGLNCSRECNCANGTSCNAVSGSCQGYCQPGWTGTDCWQRCPTGWYGLNCSHECGNCKEVDGEISCDPILGTCPDGCHRSWTGTYCDVGLLCAEQPCLHGGSCEQTEDIYRCECKIGYSGSHCETVEPACNSNPCLNNATCVGNDVDITLFACRCVGNYTGELCEVPPPSNQINDPEKQTSVPWWLKTVVPAAAGACLLAASTGFALYKKMRSPPKPDLTSTSVNESIPRDLKENNAEKKEASSPKKHNKVSPNNETKKEPTKPAKKSEMPSETQCPDGKTPKTNDTERQEQLDDADQSDQDNEPDKLSTRPTTAIMFSDRTPTSRKETIAHVTPVHKVEALEPNEGNDASAKTPDELKDEIASNNCVVPDILHPFSPDSSEQLSYPPEPPNGPTDTTNKKQQNSVSSGDEMQFHRPKSRMRLSSTRLSKLSEISLLEFYNTPRKSSIHPLVKPISDQRSTTGSNRFSAGGCALGDSEPRAQNRHQPGAGVYGVPRRDSKLLVTSARDVDEEFEMESRRGSAARLSNAPSRTPTCVPTA